MLTSLFSYNRDAFKFNAEMHQKGEFHKQKINIRQFALYREDLKDLFNLTIGRMDSYMIVSVLFIGICGEMFYKGRSPVGSPAWIFWLWSISLSSALYFLLMSLWFALHASVDAQTYQARTITQWLRLPVPGKAAIKAVTHMAEEFESGNLDSLLRIPITSSLKEGPSSSTAHQKSAEWHKFQDHFTIYKALHRRWQQSEAFARVGLSIGTNILLYAITYFGIMEYGLNYYSPLSGMGISVLCTFVSVLHLRLSLILTPYEFLSFTFFITLGPTAAVIANFFEEVNYRSRVPSGNNVTAGILGAVAIFGYLGVIILYYRITFLRLSKDSGLPIKFITVWSIEAIGSPPPVKDDDDEEAGQEAGEGVTPPVHELDQTNEDLVAAVSKAEKALNKLFKMWNVAHDKAEGNPKLDELKRQFNEEREKIYRHISKVNTETSPWIRMQFNMQQQPSQDEQIHRLASVPFVLDTKTGELRWEEPSSPPLLQVSRGISVFPEKMAEFLSATTAVEEKKKEAKLLKAEATTEATVISAKDVFKGGMLVIAAITIAALIAVILQICGISMGGQLT
jgi:hypothetical protein